MRGSRTEEEEEYRRSSREIGRGQKRGREIVRLWQGRLRVNMFQKLEARRD